MGKTTPTQRVLFSDKLKTVWLGVVFLLFASVIALAYAGLRPLRTEAATQSTINFQARLQSATGAIAPDGKYNVQFKLYDANSAGNLLWTETYQDVDGSAATTADDYRVRVQNGYLSVALGSRTTFPSTINWDQQLYLTMNIGGTTITASPTFDGEMNPRLALTAVPYAFRAGQLAQQTGANTSTLSFATQTASNNILLPNENGTLCIQNSANCGFLTSSSANGSFVQLQSGTPGTQQTGNLNISGAGIFGGTVNVGTNLSVAGTSTLTGNVNVNNLNSVLTTYTTATVVSPTTNSLSQSPVAKGLWHDLWAFNRKGAPTFEQYNGTSWNAATVDNRLFAQTENQSIQVLDGSATTAARWTWNNSGFNYSAGKWLNIGFSYNGATAANKTVLYETSADGTTWTTRHSSTGNTMQAQPAWFYVTDNGAQQYLRVTVTSTNAQPVTMNSLRLMSDRWGDQGGGSEMSYPYQWDAQQRIAVGQNAVVNNGILTIGTNTTTAAGGLYFGTDTNLYRVNTSTLKTDGAFVAAGSLTVLGTGNNYLAGNVGIGTATPAYKLDVNGDVNVAAGSNFKIGGVNICTSSGCAASGGSNGYIQNTTTQQTLANFNIDGSGTLGGNLAVGGTSTLTGNTTVGGTLTVNGASLTIAGPIKTAALTTGAEPIYIRGTGNNNPGNRVVKIGNNTLVNGTGRGLTLTIINASTHAMVSTTNYDVYGTDGDNLATAMNNMTRGQIGILTSNDAWELGVTANLRSAAQRLGLNKLGSYSLGGSRRPYAAMFYGSGISTGNTEASRSAIEIMESSNANAPTAIITSWLTEDGFEGAGSTNYLASANSDAGPAVVADSSSNVGIGTNTPGSYRLNVQGGNALFGSAVTVAGSTTLQTGASISGGLNNNSGNITNAGAVSGVTTLTMSGALTGATTITASSTVTGGSFSTTGTVSAGSVSATGNVSGSTLTSTVANGTAPLTVTSQTKVTNLNADLLDGLDSTAFATASGSGNYIQNGSTQQTGATFNIQGNGTIGGNLVLVGATVRMGLNDVLGGTAGWFKLGTVTLPQNGSAANIRMYAGAGYNAVDSQNGWVDLMIRTGNGSSTGTAGFGASASAIRYGQSSAFATGIKLKSNVAGATATQFDVYVNNGAFIGDGFYTVDTSDGGSWVNGLATATDPGAASSTVYSVPMRLDVMNTLSVSSSAVSVTGSITGSNGLTITSGGASLTGGLNNNNGNITNAGSVSGVTSLTASGTISTTGEVVATSGVRINSAVGDNVNGAPWYGLGRVDGVNVGGATSQVTQLGGYYGILMQTNGGTIALTQGGSLGVGTNNPNYKVDVNGDVNIASGSAYKINGTNICTAAGCTVAAGSTSYIQNGSTQQAGASFNVDGSGAVGTNLSVGNTIQQGNTAPIYRYVTNGEQNPTWKKVADVTMPAIAYAGAAFQIDVQNANTNYGASADQIDMRYFVSMVRSGGTADDTNSATVSGPVNDYVRVYKVANGVYELQVKSNNDYKHVNFTVQATSSLSATITYATNPPVGTNTGGTPYTATTLHTDYLTNLRVYGVSTFQSAVSVSGGLNNNGGGITNVGNVSGVGSITASGAVSAASFSATGNVTGANLIAGITTNQQVTIGGGTGNHAIEIGRTDGTATTPFIDFHSGATATDYDARIIGSGGNGSSGGGSLALLAGTTNVSGNLQVGGTQRISSGGAISNITGYTQGSGSANYSLNSGAQMKLTATAVPTTDMLNITNSGQGVTTAGINGMQIDYYGGAAAVESGATRFNITPGTTSGGIWNGVRVVAGATATGVTTNGAKYETTAGSGTQNAMYVGTGWTSALNVGGTSIINGGGVLQSAGLSGTYSNNLTLSGTGNVYSGASATVSGNINTTGGAYQVAGQTGITGACTGGQLFANANVTGGIIIGGSCVAAGSGTLNGIGTIDSQTKNANGATINGTNIILQSADANYAGLVTNAAQILAGAKTFTSSVNVSAGQGYSINSVGILVSNALSLQGASTISNTTGNLSISAAGTAVLGLDTTGAGSVTIAGANATTVNVATAGISQTVNINTTTGTGTTNISGGTGGVNLFTNNVNAKIIAKSSTNSTTAFQIQNAATTAIFNADTVNGRIGIGGVVAPATTLDVNGAIQQTGMSTPNTNATDNNKWTKLATCFINAQYGVCNMSLTINGAKGPSGTMTQANLTARVDQATALNTQPVVQLSLNDTLEYITPADIKAVSTISASSTTVDLYGRIAMQYEQWLYTPLMNQPIYGGARWAFTPGSTFIATLPTGTQYGTVYGDSVAGSLTVQPAANGTSIFQVLDAAGNQVVGVDTTNYIMTFQTPGGPGIRIGNVFGNPTTFAGITLNGSTAANSYNFLSAAAGSGTANTLFINRPTGGNIEFRQNNAMQMQLNTNGILYLNSEIDLNNGQTGGQIALKAQGQEMLWYSSSTGVASWGFGSSRNYFTRKVGILTDTPNATLGVAGSIAAQGSITGGVGAPDYAELITKSDLSIGAADVVALDPNASEHVVKSSKPYDQNMIGAISTNPGFITNANSSDTDSNTSADKPNQVPLGLSGRIPVKVTNEGGAVRPGDYLTSSSTPGYAMKATQAGPVIGKALASFDGTSGAVLMFIDNTYYNPSAADLSNQVSALQGQLDDLGSTINTANLTAGTLTVTGNASIGGNLVVSGDLELAGHIKTTGNAPTLALTTVAGSKASATVIGNDTAGTISLTIGTTPGDSMTDDLLKVTFNKPFDSAPRIVISPTGRGSASLQAFTSLVDKTYFTIGTDATLQPGKTYTYTYYAIQ